MTMTSVKFLVLSIWNVVKTEIPIFVSEWVGFIGSSSNIIGYVTPND